MKFRSRLWNSISEMLIFVDEHQHGILFTIIIHLLIITGLLIVKIQSSQTREVAVVFDFREQKDLSVSGGDQGREEEFPDGGEEMERAYAAATSNLRNLPVNQSAVESRADQNISRMVSEIKKELNVNEETAGDIEPIDESPLSPNETAVGGVRRDTKNTGSGELYRGPTSLSYELAGRTHISMPIPVYMCKGSGVVSVSIVVNPRGTVTSASVISSQTSDGSDCFTDAALTAARASRFNTDQNAADKQKGTITYTFLPQ